MVQEINSKKLKISIVIPCRNEEKFIAECIEAVYACELPCGVEIHVFVVDGMSVDSTRSIVKTLQTTYSNLYLVDNQHQLTPFAFNLGIKAGRDVDFIQIVGARHILSSNYLLRAISVLRNDHEIWCVGGRIVNQYLNVEGAIIAKAMSTPFGMGLGNFRTLDKSGYTDTVTSPLYPFWVFEKIGLFDEELARNQDDEFNFRISKAGGKIYFDHTISLKYYVRGNYKGLWRQFFQYGYWKVYVNKKHRAVTTIRQLIPPLFVLYLLLFPLTGLFGKLTLTLYAIPLTFYFLCCVVFSVQLMDGFWSFFQLIRTFPTLHLSYGLGYFKGLIQFLLLDKKPSEKEMRLSR
jgi:glycosyltransferase involved in cell wall biosynthesis